MDLDMARIPRHALTFMAASSRLAVRHGMKKGVAKAAAKANPALMAIEAVVSVVEAVDSYFTLKEAVEHRDGLRQILPYEEERLKLDRESLKADLASAQRELQQKRDIQERLGKLVLACAEVCQVIWQELHVIRTADLPDFQEFDEKLEDLERSWGQLRRALANYNDTIV